jgi:AAA ATPase domain
MRLKEARVTNYRSVRDTGWFEIEKDKTILVGINEAGKSAVLQALQQLNPPNDAPKFDPLRDYPRAKFNDITTGKVKATDTTVVQGKFVLEPNDITALPDGFHSCVYVVGRKLDNTAWHTLEDAPEVTKFGDVEKDLLRLAAHADGRIPAPVEGAPAQPEPSEALSSIIKGWTPASSVAGDNAKHLEDWLKKTLPFIDEKAKDEEVRYDALLRKVRIAAARDEVLSRLHKSMPLFVLFNNYFRVRPLIHLDHLAQRIDQKVLDDEQYDFGNTCLLKLLGFTARQLSDLGRATEPPAGDATALRKYRDQLDNRSYQLNAASVRLTHEIRSVWRPDSSKGEADRLRLQADQQYLKVVVEDELGVEIELDQRSEGFQWLVSFFVVFFAEAGDAHKNAILLLDEPGLSLHGLKQREFRNTISRLSEANQTIYTTHSPFLVGPGELDLVRVVEMTDRSVGTKVNSRVIANDAASLLPLQEALGYDLAQSLFAQRENLVLEGLTDHWYLDATAQLLRDGGGAVLDDRIAMVAAGNAGKVVYYATILHAQNLKVAALLDSDTAGDQAANQDVLVHTLGNKRILRTKDAYSGAVAKPEIEDLLRETLIAVAKEALGWDVAAKATEQPARPITDVFAEQVSDFSKYRLAKAYVRWTRDHNANELTPSERAQWAALIERINGAFV